MEYQALADLVGVKIQETPTQSASNENESGQNPSSGMISARRRAQEEIQKRVEEELKKSLEKQRLLAA